MSVGPAVRVGQGLAGSDESQAAIPSSPTLTTSACRPDQTHPYISLSLSLSPAAPLRSPCYASFVFFCAPTRLHSRELDRPIVWFPLLKTPSPPRDGKSRSARSIYARRNRVRSISFVPTLKLNDAGSRPADSVGRLSYTLCLLVGSSPWPLPLHCNSGCAWPFAFTSCFGAGNKGIHHFLILDLTKHLLRFVLDRRLAAHSRRAG